MSENTEEQDTAGENMRMIGATTASLMESIERDFPEGVVEGVILIVEVSEPNEQDESELGTSQLLVKATDPRPHMQLGTLRMVQIQLEQDHYPRGDDD